MKTFTKFLTMLAVAALFATGCVNEEPPYKEDPNPEPAGMTGYLSIGNLSMTVVYDETEIRPDDTSDETQAARIASGTRATAPDVDSFIVEILDADNAQVLEMTYAELKEQLKTPMELKVGAYRMEVRSEDTMRRGLGTPRLRCDERLYDHQGTDDLARRGGLHPAEHQGLGGIFVRAGRHA